MGYERVADRKARALAIAQTLERAYPKSTCALDYETPFQLLVATLMSAQTTDLQVNKATAKLFAFAPTPEAVAAAPPDAIETAIQGIGLWRNKARNIRELSRILVDTYDGVMPTTVEALVQLPGVGRKTATAVLGQALGVAAGITVDTHMIRIHRHLKLATSDDPLRIAADLERLLPSEYWIRYTHRIIDHGRLVCVANRPRCGVCPLANLCPSAANPRIGYRSENDARVPGSAKGLSWLRFEAGSVGEVPTS